jgi:hypothetical protein
MCWYGNLSVANKYMLSNVEKDAKRIMGDDVVASFDLYYMPYVKIC